MENSSSPTLDGAALDRGVGDPGWVWPEPDPEVTPGDAPGDGGEDGYADIPERTTATRPRRPPRTASGSALIGVRVGVRFGVRRSGIGVDIASDRYVTGERSCSPAGPTTKPITDTRVMDAKDVMAGYLRNLRADLLSKLDGLDEYQVRRPLTPTGTNLLGLVKHVASVELGYFTEVFGREPGRDLPWFADGAEADADFWATPAESRQEILDLHHHSARVSDATISELDVDTAGEVPWWPPERRQVTLHQILVHMLVETARHAGHADIIRESIDGHAGMGAGDQNLTGRTSEEWAAHVARIEDAARRAAGR